MIPTDDTRESFLPPPPFVRPLTLRNGLLTTPNNVFLAPMAGASELCYRRICRRYGAGLTMTELVSARGIRYGGINRKNERYIRIDPAENPVFIQLFGFDPEDFKAACTTILEHPVLSHCAGIDINMGCPVPKVIKTGAGAGLMKTPETAAAIIRACRDLLHQAGKPLSAKFRKGFARGENTAAMFARYLADAGVDMVTVHGRTAAMMYSGEADRDCIRAVARALQADGHGPDSKDCLPVIANGDIRSRSDLCTVLRETGAQGVMIGRAALGNPWIFAELTASDHPSKADGQPKTAPDIEERCAVILEHLDGLIQSRTERVALPEFRKTLIWYTKGSRNAVELRRQAGKIRTRAEVVELLETWKAANR